MHLSGGWNDAFALEQFTHPDEYVRCWTVRLLGDSKKVTPAIQARLVELARTETSVEVRSQLASSCKRLPARDALPIIQELMFRGEDVNDLHVPLLLWWALESKVGNDLPLVLQLLKDPALWEAPLFKKHIAARLGQRFTTERGDRFSYTLQEAEYSSWLTNYVPSRCRTSLKISGQLLDWLPLWKPKTYLCGVWKPVFAETPWNSIPVRCNKRSLSWHWLSRQMRLALAWLCDLRSTKQLPSSALLRDTALLEPTENARGGARRIAGQRAVPVFLDLLEKEPREGLRAEVLGSLQRFSNPEIATYLRGLRRLAPPSAVDRARSPGQPQRLGWSIVRCVDTGQIQPVKSAKPL